MWGYERENRDVLRRCLKTASDGAAVTWAGRSFHTAAPEAVNVRLPTVGRRMIGTCRRPEPDERSRRRDGISATWEWSRTGNNSVQRHEWLDMLKLPIWRRCAQGCWHLVHVGWSRRQRRPDTSVRPAYSYWSNVLKHYYEIWYTSDH